MRRKRSPWRPLGNILLLLLFVLTFASVTSAFQEIQVSVDHNSYETGVIRINLNDGVTVVRPDECLFAPGVTAQKDFFVRNEGTGQAYYRIYLDNITGKLAPLLEVKLYVIDGEGGAVLSTVYDGMLNEMTRDNMEFNSILDVGETEWLRISFHYPEEEGNRGQGTQLSFDIQAEATQTKNNPNAEY